MEAALVETGIVVVVGVVEQADLVVLPSCYFHLKPLQVVFAFVLDSS